MADFDLYEDLDNFQLVEEKSSAKFLELEDKYNKCLNTITELKQENKDLKKMVKTMETNFKSLLETAKGEIKRKDDMINGLRKQKDDPCFRGNRNSVVGKAKNDDNENLTEVRDSSTYEKATRRYIRNTSLYGRENPSNARDKIRHNNDGTTKKEKEIIVLTTDERMLPTEKCLEKPPTQALKFKECLDEDKNLLKRKRHQDSRDCQEIKRDRFNHQDGSHGRYNDSYNLEKSESKYSKFHKLYDAANYQSNQNLRSSALDSGKNNNENRDCSTLLKNSEIYCEERRNVINFKNYKNRNNFNENTSVKNINHNNRTNETDIPKTTFNGTIQEFSKNESEKGKTNIIHRGKLLLSSDDHNGGEGKLMGQTTSEPNEHQTYGVGNYTEKNRVENIYSKRRSRTGNCTNKGDVDILIKPNRKTINRRFSEHCMIKDDQKTQSKKCNERNIIYAIDTISEHKNIFAGLNGVTAKSIEVVKNNICKAVKVEQKVEMSGFEEDRIPEPVADAQTAGLERNSMISTQSAEFGSNKMVNFNIRKETICDSKEKAINNATKQVDAIECSNNTTFDTNICKIFENVETNEVKCSTKNFESKDSEILDNQISLTSSNNVKQNEKHNFCNEPLLPMSSQTFNKNIKISLKTSSITPTREESEATSNQIPIQPVHSPIEKKKKVGNDCKQEDKLVGVLQTQEKSQPEEYVAVIPNKKDTTEENLTLPLMEKFGGEKKAKRNEGEVSIDNTDASRDYIADDSGKKNENIPSNLPNKKDKDEDCSDKECKLPDNEMESPVQNIERTSKRTRILSRKLSGYYCLPLASKKSKISEAVPLFHCDNLTGEAETPTTVTSSENNDLDYGKTDTGTQSTVQSPINSLDEKVETETSVKSDISFSAAHETNPTNTFNTSNGFNQTQMEASDEIFLKKAPEELSHSDGFSENSSNTSEILISAERTTSHDLLTNQIDKSQTTKKISLGSKDYVIEKSTPGVVNMYITRNRNKKKQH